MTISLRMPEEDAALIKSYVALHGTTISEFARKSMLEAIEDEHDRKAIEEYEQQIREGTLKTYSHEEVWKMLGI